LPSRLRPVKPSDRFAALRQAREAKKRSSSQERLDAPHLIDIDGSAPPDHTTVRTGVAVHGPKVIDLSDSESTTADDDESDPASSGMDLDEHLPGFIEADDGNHAGAEELTAMRESTVTHYAASARPDRRSELRNQVDSADFDDALLMSLLGLVHEVLEPRQGWLHRASLRLPTHQEQRRRTGDDAFRLWRQRARGMIDAELPSLVQSASWKPEFKRALDRFPKLGSVGLDEPVQGCRACGRALRRSTMTLHFKGVPYDRETLRKVEKEDDEGPTVFQAGEHCQKLACVALLTMISPNLTFLNSEFYHQLRRMQHLRVPTRPLTS
jgi:hypothetical protein